MKSAKLYVLVRKDLSPGQQAVQSGHAVAEYLQQHETPWDNGILVYLGVKNLLQLEKWENFLKSEEVAYSKFYEPDIDQETSLSFVYDSERRDSITNKLSKLNLTLSQNVPCNNL